MGVLLRLVEPLGQDGRAGVLFFTVYNRCNIRGSVPINVFLYNGYPSVTAATSELYVGLELEGRLR